mgnify:CR=1 FL=1
MMALNKKQRLTETISRLKTEYPSSKCSLIYQNPFQLLVATILSAQCTDERVNKVTAILFQKYPDVYSMAKLSRQQIGKEIYSTGFYNNKSRSIKSLSETLIMEYGGKVPRSLEELVKLSGVGRKTANVVLGNAFNIPGITVDTHVTRISNLLGLVETKNAVKIEFQLMEIMDSKNWTQSGHLFIDHGRKVCIARRPQCVICVLKDLCPSAN